jgi:hypothetical protein
LQAIASALVGFAVMVAGRDRIMLLAHYVSDVGAGLVLGVALDKVVGRLLAFVRAGGDQ